jgi:branched-subunit amino acid ABC-type transport system permease component
LTSGLKATCTAVDLRVMEIAWALGPFLAGFFGAYLGMRMGDRPTTAEGKPARVFVGGLMAAFLAVAGAMGLTLTAVVVLVQDKPLPLASIMCAVMLAVGLFDHFSERRALLT